MTRRGLFAIFGAGATPAAKPSKPTVDMLPLDANFYCPGCWWILICEREHFGDPNETYHCYNELCPRHGIRYRRAAIPAERVSG